MPCSTALVPTGFQSKWAHEEARRQNDLGSLQCYPIKGCIKNTLGAGALPAVCMKHSHRDGLQGDRASQSILPHPSVCCPRAGDLKQLCNSGLGQCRKESKAEEKQELCRVDKGTTWNTLSAGSACYRTALSLQNLCSQSGYKQSISCSCTKGTFFPLFLNC